MQATTIVTFLLLAGTTLLAPAAAQDPLDQSVFAFDLEVPDNGVIQVPMNGVAFMAVVLHDRSRDTPAGIAGNGLPATGIPHQVQLKAEAVTFEKGWSVQVTPPTVSTYGGGTADITVQFSVGGEATSPTYEVNLTAIATATDGRVYTDVVRLIGKTPGVPLFTVLGSGYKQVAPREIWDAEIRVSNNDLVAHTFEVEAPPEANPCGVGVGLPSTFTVPPKTFQYQESVTFSAPELSSLFGVGCQVGIRVTPVGSGVSYMQYYTVYVQGIHYDVPSLFWAVVALLVLVLLVLVARRRKERIEEEILGKPQKPWTIPAERVYLKHLKAKDERAAYVVRHYLMEDEYRSALLWYKAYKKATRSERGRERQVLAQERSYARWKAREDRKVAKPMLEADRLEAKLQRRIDREARGEHKAAVRRWGKDVERIQAAHAKQAGREAERHAKAVRKAEKKGLPVPPPPVVAAPDLPPEPRPGRVLLADHKLARKAERFRRKMAKRQGDLEVRLEKADARRQAKMERRVAKLTRDLDDPDFVAEHAPPGRSGTAGRPAK